MIQVETATPSPEPQRIPSLADLSRNASVISTGSSSSSTHGDALLLTPPRRPRPIRTFSSPRSQSPGGPTTPRSSRPPAYITRELGYAEEPQLLQPASSQRASSKSKSRSASVNRPSRDDFDFGEILGEGSYSTVIHVTHRESGREYACKVLDKQHLKRHNKLQTALAEKNTLVRLSSGHSSSSALPGSGHPGIVRLHYAFQDEWSLFFVIDLARNGELQSRISRMGSLSTACARYYAAQVVDALDYMHSKGVIHRDLKPENLLLDDAFRLKVTDFGTGKLIDITAEHATKTFVGTAQYVSPELLEANETSKSSDLWALGCVLYQMIAGRFAFQGLSEYLTWQKIKMLEYSFPEGFDEQAKDLVRQLLVRDPLQRLGAGLPGSDNDMAALRAHAFFAPINWPTLWTDPAPPLETGLVRREGPPAGVGVGSDWDDVGQAWDDLVGESSDEGESPGGAGDGIGWAPDAQGAEYALFGARATLEANYVPPEDVGPRGELPDYARERIVEVPPPPPPPALSSPTSAATALSTVSTHRSAVIANGLAEPPTGSSGATLVVQGNGAINFQLPPLPSGKVSPPVSSNGTATTDSMSSTSGGTTPDGSLDRVAIRSEERAASPAQTNGAAHERTESGEPQTDASKPVGVPAKRVDTYATSSSDGSPVEKLGAALDAMRLARGRHRTRSPATRPPLEPDWSSVLLPGETMLFDSEVEETVMKRRTSRLLLPLPVAPRKPKVRQLVLTERRLVCLKQMKSGRGIGVKSEYGLRPSEKEKEKEREKEERCLVTGVAIKGGREFVMFTTKKSAFFVAQDERTAETWVSKISEAIQAQASERERKLSGHGAMPSAGATSRT
ncbi:kinase-like domain-containing protein [Vararia minispora EC-137]|uniref:Kinase-like domain-containing protein n=1 Tax=Vararia minispora EC-137 TaxID=1314806 RepID=A0ACB8R013_9AGAM|nr:kinase-like domain-containing protein [Vararia minispora EC-137]